MVTFSPPMRPAMRVPLNTRAGVAQAPMEPGARCTRWVPWRGPLAGEVVTLHDAGEALALADGGDVDAVAGGEEVDADLLADLVAVDVVEAELDEPHARGRRPALAKWPASGLVSFLASFSP